MHAAVAPATASLLGLDAGAATFWLMLASQAVLWALMLRSGVLAKGRTDAEHAASEGTATAAIRALTREFAHFSEKMQTHLLDDAKFQARTEQIITQQSDTQATLARMQENQQAQINNLARDLPLKPHVDIPANRGRR